MEKPILKKTIMRGASKHEENAFLMKGLKKWEGGFVFNYKVYPSIMVRAKPAPAGARYRY